jgi:iron complex outermembrane receptor protein
MRRRRLRWIGSATALLASTWCYSGLAGAQTPHADAPDIAPELEEIVITATGAEKALVKIPAAVGRVDVDDIQLGRQQLALDESLVKVPGVFLQNRYNFAQDSRIAIRGFGARSSFGIRGIRLIVDGIPATMPDGQAGVDSIDIGSARSIEVIRGPASSRYGAAAGGVIRIFTEEGPEQPFAESRVSLGAHDFHKIQLKAGGQSGRLNYLLNLSRLELDGYRRNSHTESLLLNGKLRYAIDESSELSAVVNAVDSPRAEDPGGLTAEEVKEDPRQARERNLLFDTGEELDQRKLGLVYRKVWSSEHEIEVRNFYLWRSFRNKLPFESAGSVDLERFLLGGGAEYTWSEEIWGRSNRLIVGVEATAQRDERKRFDNDEGSIGALAFDQLEKVSSLGALLQDEFSLLDQLELSIGARYDRIRFEVDDHFVTGDDDDQSGDQSFDEFSPMAGLVWSPFEALNLYGNVSTSFETPTTTEFANPDGSGGFNQDLESQTAINFEIGAKGILPGRVRYDLALFLVKIRDELVPFELDEFPDREFFRNAGRSTRRGLELGLTAQPLPGLVTSLAYTYSDFEFDRFRVEPVVDMGRVVDDGNRDGNQIPGIPEHQLHAEISYHHKSGFYAIWDLLFVSELFADDANTAEMEAYVVSGLRAGYRKRLGSWELSPFAGINNLFDEEYNGNVRINAREGRFFEPAPGINLYGGLALAYRFGPSP